MRDKQFVAVHRGGFLTINDHRRLIRWARKCSKHVLYLINDIDVRLIYALKVAKEWERGNAKTQEAMKASLKAHAAAREYTNEVSTAVARSVGHAVATAHMADHCVGAALYAAKAVKLADGSVEEETEWQIKELRKLPPKLAELVIDLMNEKKKGFKILR